MGKLQETVQLLATQSTDTCIEWPRSIDAQGYGRCWWEGKLQYAHRVVWRASGRPDPSELSLHHQCKRRSCVNPRHLVPMVPAEHMRLHRKAFCRKGHRKRASSGGRWYCPTCNVDRVRRWRARHPETARALDRRWYEQRQGE